MNLLKIKNYTLPARRRYASRVAGGKTSRGYIAISTVLIISSVILVLSIMITKLSINSAQSSLSVMKSEETLGFIDGCAEDGLIKSQGSIGYVGGDITRPEGTCRITMSKVGTVWSMTVTTLDPKYQKTVLVTFDRSPLQITLKSWKEI